MTIDNGQKFIKLSVRLAKRWSKTQPKTCPVFVCASKRLPMDGKKRDGNGTEIEKRTCSHSTLLLLSKFLSLPTNWQKKTKRKEDTTGFNKTLFKKWMTFTHESAGMRHDAGNFLRWLVEIYSRIALRAADNETEMGLSPPNTLFVELSEKTRTWCWSCEFEKEIPRIRKEKSCSGLENEQERPKNFRDRAAGG